MDKNYLVYEQGEVRLLDKESEADIFNVGKLRILDKGSQTLICWSTSFDFSQDDDWAVISPTKLNDITKVNNFKKVAEPISIEVKENLYLQVTNQKTVLEILDCNKHSIATFRFNTDCYSNNAEFFVDVLSRYYTIREQNRELTLFKLVNKQQADLDDQLSALNLVPERSKHRFRHTYHSNWAGQAPRKVFGFINNMKRDPYNTAVDTLAKVYDLVLFGDVKVAEVENREDDEDVGKLLQIISGNNELEPGYEILTKKEQLADRPNVTRLSPLCHEEYKTYVENDGSISRVDALKQRIFKGGIHPNLRPELWCYLLDVYDWNLTTAQICDTKKRIEDEYFTMKKQWKTFSQMQEDNFSGYRDRKSIIEKDVNRTDRNHPFYEGDTNPNLQMLNDILMTYIMYNFDLGYVQGMSDLLAPILYVLKNEALAFWCFVGYMNRVYRNFDLDQSGMKQQLSDLTQVLKILDPEFMSFLEAQDCANMFFCFRWLLVRFKRELNYTDTLKLWEILWTDHLCANFHLCFAVSILDTERDKIVERKFGFTDVLKHINGLSLHIDVEGTLKNAESIHEQLKRSDAVPNTVRGILALPLLSKPVSNSRSNCEPIKGLPGKAQRLSIDNNAIDNNIMVYDGKETASNKSAESTSESTESSSKSSESNSKSTESSKNKKSPPVLVYSDLINASEGDDHNPEDEIQFEA